MSEVACFGYRWFGVGVIPLMPDYKTSSLCLNLVSMTLSTSNLTTRSTTNCRSSRHALGVAWLESTFGRLEVPSSWLRAPLDSDARRRAFPQPGPLPLRLNALR